MQGKWVQSLVAELRSHILWGNWAHEPQWRPNTARKKKKKKRGGLFWNGSLGSCSVTTQRVICESSRWSVNSLQNRVSYALYRIFVFLKRVMLYFLILPLWLSWWRICLQYRRPQFTSWVGKIHWRRERLPTLVFWSGELHRLYSPWGCKESNMTEWLSLTYKSYIWNVLMTKTPLEVLLFHVFWAPAWRPDTDTPTEKPSKCLSNFFTPTFIRLPCLSLAR